MSDTVARRRFDAVFALVIAGGMLAILIAALVPASAQQTVAITNATYDPCFDPTKIIAVPVDQSAASTDVQVLALSGSTKIYLCSGRIQGGAAGKITLRFGTGSACASSPTDIDVISVVANGDGPLILPGSGSATFEVSAAGQAFCFTRSASMTAIGHFRLVQE